jgi:acetamidase/formamidase family protein
MGAQPVGEAGTGAAPEDLEIRARVIRYRRERSQGDGEITFCGAVEMAGFLDIGVDLIKGGVERAPPSRRRAKSRRSRASPCLPCLCQRRQG